MNEMKDNSISRIGTYPVHWKIKRLKELFRESKEVSSTGEEDLLSVSEYYGVARRMEKMTEDEKFESRSDSLIGYKKVHPNNLVINIMLAWKKGLGISDYEGIVSPAYAVFNPINIVPKYYHYLLRSEQAVCEFKRYSKGIIDSRLRLYTDKFYAISVPVPPLKEQKAIAKYLDEKIEAIDTNIDIRTSELRLLEDLKRSEISTVVMRGLNPDVSMKDSGISWIGYIPKHWEVKRIKEFAKTVKGRQTDYLDEVKDGAMRVLSLEILRQDVATFYEYIIPSDASQICTKGDIVIIWDGAGVGELLKAKNGVLSSTIAKIIFNEKKILPAYFWQWRYHIEYRMKSIPTGMGIPHLNPNLFYNYLLPVPPIEEQRAIAEYLDEKVAKIDKKIAIINNQIEAYKKLKCSLIDEVVTGKKGIL